MTCYTRCLLSILASVCLALPAYGQSYLNSLPDNSVIRWANGPVGFSRTNATTLRYDGSLTFTGTIGGATSAELARLSGVTSGIQSQLDTKLDAAGYTASRALTTNGSGSIAVSLVTAVELGYLDGVNSSVQTQLNDLDTAIQNVAAGSIDLSSLADNDKIGWANNPTGLYRAFSNSIGVDAQSIHFPNPTNPTTEYSSLSWVVGGGGFKIYTAASGGGLPRDITVEASGDLLINASAEVIIEGMAWPTTAGTNGQVLTTNGVNQLAWTENTLDLSVLADNTVIGWVGGPTGFSRISATATQLDGSLYIAAGSAVVTANIDATTDEIQLNADGGQVKVVGNFEVGTAVLMPENSTLATKTNDYPQFTLANHRGSQVGAVTFSLASTDYSVAIGGQYDQPDWGHTGVTTPTLFIHSANSPATNGTEWISVTHDATSGQIKTGTGDLVLNPASNLYVYPATTFSVLAATANISAVSSANTAAIVVSAPANDASFTLQNNEVTKWTLTNSHTANAFEIREDGLDGAKIRFSISGGDVIVSPSGDFCMSGNNVKFGKLALAANTGSYNTAIGDSASASNTSGGGNVAIGVQAAQANLTGGMNVAIGAYAGQAVLGTGNVFLGANAGKTETGSDKLYIANSSADTLIYGNFSTKLVGINTTSPTEALDINSDAIRIRQTSTPASATAAGQPGEIRWDSSYIYICVGVNQWKRVAISTW